MNEMNDVKVSIITVCFNSEKTISKTIESVINQTYDNYEYIIVDGNSTDNTLSIVEKYSSHIRDLLVISEPDNGIYDAMNKGIDRARGEIISIINSDDWLEKDAVERVVDEYIRIGKPCLAVIYGALRVVDKDVTRYEVFYNHKFIPAQMIGHPSSFVTKNVYERYGKFDTKFKLSADYDLFLRLYEEELDTNSIIFYPLSKVLANFSIGGASCSIESSIDHERVLLKHGLIDNKTYRRHYIVRKIKQLFKYE